MDIKYIKDNTGNDFFPVVHEKGVVDNNGTTLESKLQSKQDVINDIDTIRNGAALGATSIQSHQDISGKANVDDVYTKTQVDTILRDKQDALADSEDVVKVTGENGTALNFANKTYNGATFSGLGRTYLRKNIVTIEGVEKNILTQAMVSDANTIYHIQYDFTLGEDITVPANCVLEFDGGKVINGNIVCNDNVTIIGGYFSNVTIAPGHNTVIRKCTLINDVLKQNIYVNAYEHAFGNTTIEDCYIENSATPSISGEWTVNGGNCIELRRLTNNVDSFIIRNNIFKTKRMAFVPWARTAESTDIYTINNIVVENNQFETILEQQYVDDKHYACWPISIDYASDSNIIIKNLNITNNTIKRGYYGIELVGVAENTIVIGNSVENTRIPLASSQNIPALIANNMFISNSGRVTIGKGNVFQSNILKNTNILLSGSDIVISKNIVSIDENYESTYSGFTHCIYGNNVENIIVVDNSLTNNLNGAYCGNISGTNIIVNGNTQNNSFIINNSEFNINNRFINFKRYVPTLSLSTLPGLIGDIPSYVPFYITDLKGYRIKTENGVTNVGGNINASQLDNLKTIESIGVYTLHRSNDRGTGLLFVMQRYNTSIVQVLLSSQKIDVSNNKYVNSNLSVTHITVMKRYYVNNAWTDWSIVLISDNNDNTRPELIQSKSIGIPYFDRGLNKNIWWNGTKWVDSNGAAADASHSGDTASRPVGSDIYVGFMYMDTSISPARPIYASAISGNTVTWVDATGTPV